jgi:hypothetical protein
MRSAGATAVASIDDKVGELAAGTPAANGERPCEIVEAASSGNLDQILGAVPPEARQLVSDTAREGVLTGLNGVLMLAALLSFAGEPEPTLLPASAAA